MAHDDVYSAREPAFNGLFSPRILLFLLALLLAWLAWRGCPARPLHDPEAELRPVVARGELAQDERATIELFRAAAPAVVQIDTTHVIERRGFLRSTYYEVPEGTGSGFVWDGAGHVVTNLHVVGGATRCLVRMADHSEWDARFVGGSPEDDLAVLAIDAPIEKLALLPIGRSRDLEVGQKVFAIGNPFGLEATLTSGLISGLDRVIPAAAGGVIEGAIQTDAAINPGNSGGPLLDSAGRLIGVNTAIASTSGSSAGVGFAVPVDTVNRVVASLIQSGQPTRPLLGALLATDASARASGAPAGALLREILPASAAERAGLESGDIVVSLDGRAIQRRDDLLEALAAHRSGDRVRLGLVRASDGRREELEVELQELERRAR
jgi:S1-C subfamily serine protease